MFTATPEATTSEIAKNWGLGHKLLRSLDAAGLEPRDLNTFAEHEQLPRELFGVMRGWMQMRPVEFVIDADAHPKWEWGGGSNWPIEKHRRMGKVVLTRLGEQLYINGQEIIFHFFETKPSPDGRIDEFKLEEELRGKEVLNTNFMIFLRRNMHLIPESWSWLGNSNRDNNNRSLAIYFWGTEQRHVNGCRCIPMMYPRRIYSLFWECAPGWVGDKGQYTPGVAAILKPAV